GNGFLPVIFIEDPSAFRASSESRDCTQYGPDRVEFYLADVSSKEEFTGVFQKIVDRFGLWFVPTAPIYRATKYAVVGFSRAIAVWLSNLGVRINILSPGVVKTNLLSSPNLEDHFGQFSELEGLKEMVLERNDFEVEKYSFSLIMFILVTDESKNREILKIDVYVRVPQILPWRSNALQSLAPTLIKLSYL
uniref:Uncharacterized protein n=1 Tax=Sinocyclocheilus grahami TaxID=75366 RepID=A0A672P9D8_SINGR